MSITAGDVVNNWLVIREAGTLKDHHKCYVARCMKCGYMTTISYHGLRQNTKGTCKHFQRTAFHVQRLHDTFNAMVNRCYNPKNKAFRFYGGKGVTVCNEWLTNPEAFEQWALANGYADNMTIDRINSNSGYSPVNCRWVSGYMNSKWKKTTNHFTVNGITDSGRGWATRLSCNVNFFNVYARKHSKEETEQLIADILSGKKEVTRRTPRQYTVNGRQYTIAQLANELNLTKQALHNYVCSHGVERFVTKMQDMFAGGEWEKPSRNEIEIYGVIKTESEWSRAVHRVDGYFGANKYAKGIDFAIAKIKQLLHTLPDDEIRQLNIKFD